MSAPPTITRLLDAFDRWRVDYRPTTSSGVPWTKRNRNSVGRWNDLIGIVDHHTATSASLSIVPNVLSLLARGRSDLPGPLCHFAPSPDGRLYLIGWGRANHAGKFDADVVRAVRNESYGTNPPAPNYDSVDANALFYGFEIIHPGDGSPYPDRQIECTVRANAAICELHGWSAKSVIQHGEGTHRKPDMSWQGGPRKSGPAIRAEVARALREGPDVYSYPAGRKPTNKPQPRPKPPEDDLPYTEKQLRDIVRSEVTAALAPVPGNVWSHRLRHANGRLVTAESQIQRIELQSWRAWKRTELALTALAEIGTAVASIAPAAANVVGKKLEASLNALLAQGDAAKPDETPEEA